MFLSSVGELAAGVVLAAMTNTLEELVGLAVLIPAAIAMRGAIFGAMGSRLSTAIHTGLFRIDFRRGPLAENVQAAIVLSLVSGVFLAFLARYISGILGVETTLTIFDYVVISTVAGILAGVLLLVEPFAIDSSATRLATTKMLIIVIVAHRSLMPAKHQLWHRPRLCRFWHPALGQTCRRLQHLRLW